MAGGRERPLRVEARGARKLDAGAEVEAGRIAIVGRGGRARLGDHLVRQRLEIVAIALEAGRVHVRGVVRDHLHPEALGIQAGSRDVRSEAHTSELQSLMRISYAACLLTKKSMMDVAREHNG